MSASVGYLGDFEAKVGIVLGSGLGTLVDAMHVVEEIGFEEIKDYPVSTVPGHEGNFLFGSIGTTEVIVAQGRVHLYEGVGPWEVVKAMTFFEQCGLERVVLTNAAGTVNPEFAPGRWMMLSDHLNLTGSSPFLGEAKFHDMGHVYSPDLRGQFREAADAKGMTLYEGVYAGVLGPQYETPAEVRMLRGLGADAVGMSTVLEAMKAHALGMEVAAFSCLTNWGAGMGDEELNHEEVLEAGKEAAGELVELLAEVLFMDGAE
ncbi:MAG: purine-nucleoside phosphorylase [Verrucomicrobiales bacterium]|nr:purine-nucleoside phosphorylase [Verrucomicrobiales bacterium]